MYAVISDIHGNMYAFRSVIEDMKKYDIEGVLFLGDLIDYGMQSNEVIDYLTREFNYNIICNIWGNHEASIMTEDYSRFSSERGVESAKYTKSILNDSSFKYIDECMRHSGYAEFEMLGKKCLAVHGSLDDIYWRAIEPDLVRGEYSDYDLVFSGHSHYSHFFNKFYVSDDAEKRNRHSVIFINPGSVGQPRNHNPQAQYVLFDMNSLSVIFRAVDYDISAAMDLYDGHLDDFYRKRLLYGI